MKTCRLTIAIHICKILVLYVFCSLQVHSAYLDITLTILYLHPKCRSRHYTWFAHKIVFWNLLIFKELLYQKLSKLNFATTEEKKILHVLKSPWSNEEGNVENDFVKQPTTFSCRNNYHFNSNWRKFRQEAMVPIGFGCHAKKRKNTLKDSL